MSTISIIIITYNRPEDALGLLQDIEKLNNKAGLLKEVILLNNASSKDYGKVRDFVKQHPDSWFRYIDATSNLGVSMGRNYAASLATGDIFVFLDDDVVIENQDLLNAFAKAFSRNTGMDRRLGTISCKVRYYSNREVQVNAFPHKQYNAYKDLPWFLTGYYVGCAHAFLRECWLAAGNYPDDFFYGMEEYDLSYRVLEAGYAIGYDASVEVFHKESPHGRTAKSEKLQMMWVNKSIVAWRYLPLLYFFTTTIAWSAFYLVKSRFALPGLFKGWIRVLGIPFQQARKQVQPGTRQYLRQVKARLWF
ncbi:glycosyltransferase family 2 protein [Flavihumibacter profundi]|uniref:glycosyltransferase family 2 protein n=1 Tax=Flavihumibacter profundi TaxID=2716883 RepID=UPI001CC7D390|nr:glycosyltransferase [Flavihumibacter profundi]MBZ5856363.1 glycosyltransferase [Flavihumibacter profundi]